MRTKEEILDNMIEEMPFQLIGKDQVLPYIKEAMEIYAQERVNELDSKRLFLVGYVHNNKFYTKEVEAPNELAAKYMAIRDMKWCATVVRCVEI